MDDVGRSLSGRATHEPSQQAVSAVPVGIPNALWPVYEFRPLPELLRGEVFRFADGEWLADDGEYDLAFIAYGAGAPMAYYVDMPYQRNIIWSGLTGHWSSSNYDHPRANPWHYLLRDGETEWGGAWGRDAHPNRRAGDKAMRECAARNRCANGSGPEFKHGDRHILAGLVRERDTKIIVTPPKHLTCMFCGSKWHEAAQGMAARSGETGTGSAEGNSPVRQDAPTPTPETDHG